MHLRWIAFAFLVAGFTNPGRGQTPPLSPAADGSELRYVVYVERHGVRSPTSKGTQNDQYTTTPWPVWAVPPGYLTPHGYELIRLFGAYDRFDLSRQHLLSASGCQDVNDVTIYADSDQRTRETGKAIAAGLFPGCQAAVLGNDEGVNDPLFHLPAASISSDDAALSRAAIAGRIGDDPHTLAEAYRTQLEALDHLFATCGSPVAGHKRTSIFDVPATLTQGSGDHLADLRGPLSTSATLTENLLLEYTEGFPAANVGWGCVDGESLRSLINLHTASVDLSQRTPMIAAAQASSLLKAIDASLQQAASQVAVAGALGRPGDRALFLVGHDTNLANLAGALELDWLLDGRRDDTPPGSALVFQLWQSNANKNFFVRVFFTAQTLEQMRSGTALSAVMPPPKVPVFVPGCRQVDFSCSLPELSRLIHAATKAHQ